MIKITKLINIVYNDLQSKSNILSLSKWASNESRKLIIFDKTKETWVSDFLKKNEITTDNILVFKTAFNQGLVETVISWGTALEDFNNHYVQILAEDDVFLDVNDAYRNNDNNVTMFICQIAFLYETQITLENCQNVLLPVHAKNISKVFKTKQIFGDSSWHALIRSDVFFAYSRWVNSLPLVFWHISNMAVWTALYFGSIDKLDSFIFVKDSVKWSNNAKSNKLLAEHYRDKIGIASHSLLDNKIYLMTCLMHLLWLEINYHNKVDRELYIKLISMINIRPSLIRLVRLDIDIEYIKHCLNYGTVKVFLILSSEPTGKIICEKTFNRTLLKIINKCLDDMPKEINELIIYFNKIVSKWKIIIHKN